MSDTKRATFITVSAAKGGNNKANKTVRLTINLDESNESKYPELNYKELVIAEENKLKKKPVENGIANDNEGLHPFSDNDDDVERVARKFEQKYGSKSSYGKKGRSKQDDFADIGAGYDENDSFIDNTDGYDEMIPPECDTFYGGFYINCGSLEFKNNPDYSDGEQPQPHPGRNKRRISSSSSSSQSDSSSGSDSGPETAMVNGDHSDRDRDREHRKKNKNLDKKKAKKVRRTDSSAATSGKQTSDDNGHADSGESRTSQSDSLASKPARSSDPTSDSSRDIEARGGPGNGSGVVLSSEVNTVIGELEVAVAAAASQPGVTAADLEAVAERHIGRLDRIGCASSRERDAALARAADCLRAHGDPLPRPEAAAPPRVHAAKSAHKRKASDEDHLDVRRLTDEERETKIVETLQRLKALIEERKPGMIANYNAECQRVQEERKKIQIASASEGAPHIEKRLPKRRFPWCQRTRSLLHRLKGLAGGHEQAALLLAKRALPLFPNGFVRMPTLLRQADLHKEMKVAELKRQKLGSASLPLPTSQPMNTQQASQSANQITFMEPIQFPSSLTVTTTKASPEKTENINTDDNQSFANASVYANIMNSFSISKSLVVEKQEERKTSVIVDKKESELYIPPNNIGSITITPVPSNHNKDKKISTSKNTNTDKNSEPLLRIKSPAALNEMVKKDKERDKERDKDRHKHKREKDSSSYVKESQAHVKDRIVINDNLIDKNSRTQKESTIKVKHTYIKDPQMQVKDLQSRAKDSNSYVKDNVNREHQHQHKDSQSRVKDPTQHQHKDSQSRVKDPTQHQHKDTSRVKDPQFFKDSHHHSEKNSHNRPKDQSRVSQHKDTITKDTVLQLHDNSRHKDTETRIKEILAHVKDIPNQIVDRRLNSPLHIDTNLQIRHSTPSPKSKEGASISKKQIETMRVAENKIPRPALVPVHHSPTFAKPDKRPPDVKKKKDLLIVSDVDPLSEQNEPVAIDDSDSDVELVEDTKSESVPVKNKDASVVNKSEVPKDKSDTTMEDFHSLMQNIRDLEHSQESPKLTSSNSYSGVITSAKRTGVTMHTSSSQPPNSVRTDKNKFAERTSLNKTDGCSTTADEPPRENLPTS